MSCDDLGDVDLGGRTINIASINRSVYLGEVSVERYVGETVNDAVYKRNKMVEDRLNITINNIIVGEAGANQYAVIQKVGEHFRAGSHEYDIMVAPVYCTIMYTGNGYLHNLKKAEALDLTKPYWHQGFNAAASVGDGNQFCATGAVSLRFYRAIYVTLINDRVLQDGSKDLDLFKVVNDGDWTLEYQRVLASKYYDDIGVQGKDKGDGFGLLTTDYNGVDGYWSSCGITICEKTDDNYFRYSLNKERLSNVVDVLINMFTAEYTWCEPHDGAHESGNGEWPAIYEKFAEGSTLMATIKLEGVEDSHVQKMKDEYSILPIPKYEKDQEKNNSFTQASFTGSVFGEIAKDATTTVRDLKIGANGAAIKAENVTGSFGFLANTHAGAGSYALVVKETQNANSVLSRKKDL